MAVPEDISQKIKAGAEKQRTEYLKDTTLLDDAVGAVTALNEAREFADPNLKDKQDVKSSYDLTRERLELTQRAVHLDQDRQFFSSQQRFAMLIFSLVVAWLYAVLIVVFLCGLRILTLSDAVLVALLGTTTVNVLALFAAVTAWLYPKQKE